MIVNQFNTFPYGGAATAAKRLHHELRQQQIDSRFFYHLDEKQSSLDDSFHSIQLARPGKRLFASLTGNHFEKKRRKRIYREYDSFLKDHDSGGEVFAMAELPEKSRLDWPAMSADVVHLHWISFMADYPSFFGSIPDSVPIVWTLHDMNPITGGCHYSNGCAGFKSGCGNCPLLKVSFDNDLSASSFKVKQAALKRKRIHIVTPSQWLCDLARQSPLLPDGTTFEVIRLGFDTAAFRPVDKRQARKELGLPEDARLIAFGAEDIRNQRKGFGILLESLSKLKTETRTGCIVFGSGNLPDESGNRLPEMFHQGFVRSIEKQALIYSAADVVVVPSREDNSPQVGLEAMACGTPVVGFDSGGIPEYVRHGETGLIAAAGDADSLADCLSQMLNSEELCLRTGAAAREMILREYELTRQTGKYVGLYRQLTGVRQETSQNNAETFAA